MSLTHPFCGKLTVSCVKHHQKGLTAINPVWGCITGVNLTFVWRSGWQLLKYSSPVYSNWEKPTFITQEMSHGTKLKTSRWLESSHFLNALFWIPTSSQSFMSGEEWGGRVNSVRMQRHTQSNTVRDMQSNVPVWSNERVWLFFFLFFFFTRGEQISSVCFVDRSHSPGKTACNFHFSLLGWRAVQSHCPTTLCFCASVVHFLWWLRARARREVASNTEKFFKNLQQKRG